MKKLVLFFALAFPSLINAQIIPFDSNRWTIEANESSVDYYLGKQSLKLKGGIAYLNDVEFLNGIIEFDIAISNVRGFAGGIFRMQDQSNYEDFYLRPHQSGNPDANQYTPVFNGISSWQLYHGEGYGAAVNYQFNKWMHVRIIVSGQLAEVYIMDMNRPVVIISDLKRKPESGSIGIKVGDFSPAHFSNFQYEISNPIIQRQNKSTIITELPNSINVWEVSNPFPETLLQDKLELVPDQILNWKLLDCEANGLANLARVVENIKGNTVFAKVIIESKGDQFKKFVFGFSDRIRVYLNNKLLYTGNNNYRSRDYRYLGTIGYFDEIILSLKKGRNVLLLAISEDFGGWGVMAKFPDMVDIEIKVNIR